jgi:hypothetical protein
MLRAQSARRHRVPQSALGLSELWLFARSRRVAVLLLGLLACSDGSGPSESSLKIHALGPNRVAPAYGSFVIEVRGTGFADSAVVHWDGSPRETVVDSDTYLAGFILNSDVAAPDTVSVQVVNPDGTRSNSVRFIIAPGAIPSAIDSVVPGTDGELSPGAPVTVYFNEALDQSSLTDTSFTVRDESGPVSGDVSYDETARALTFAVQLTPARRFTAHLSAELRSTGAGIYGARDWGFSTSLGPSVVLDTVSGWPSMVLGLDGRPRAAYQWRETVGFTRLKLAACIADCTRPQGWSLSTIDQTGSSGSYASLARDALGRLHYGYQDFHNGVLYSAGASQRTIIEGSPIGAFTTIAATPSGAIHLMYYTDGDLRGASCSSACTDPPNWGISTVDADGNAGSFGSVAVDAGGGVHVIYYENDAGDLRYATCPAPCSAPNWTSGSIATSGQVGIGSSLVVDGTGRLHATWLDATANTVMYGTCSTSCTTAGNWSMSSVEQVATTPVDYGFYYTSLALGPGGQLEASYMAPEQGLLRGASCASSCATPGAWSPFTVSFRGTRGLAFRMTSLKVSPDGQRHVVWSDRDGQLRYARY